MADANARLNIIIDSGQAISQLRNLQSQINSFNKSITSSNSAAAAQQASLNKALMDGANASRMFSAGMVPVTSTLDTFSRSLEKNKLSLGEYTRYAASQLPGMSRVFRREFDTMTQIAESRVKKLQAQYTALGQSANGVQKALQITPTGLAKGYATDLALATQRQQIFNKLIDDGSTKLLNWGKNTQWAGRQLMVGFSLPLAAFGAAAAQAFMELDKASISFQRVYGDLNTTTGEMQRNLDTIKELGKEYTKYGIAVKDTVDIAARAAATGATNEQLQAATQQTLRFATLGQIDYNTALDATISLQTAFGISNSDLASKIDFLNAVENQTILTINDMALAIPRVATVVKGLGGDVEDLAVFMTAMREGGVSAENAANALKSGLASLINPTKAATQTLAGFGININEIITANKGDLMATVKAFGQALSTLSEFERQQALEKVFGKFQYARMGALFTNIINDAGQASRAMDLAGMSVQDLANLSEKELAKVEQATSTKFKAAVEGLKVSIAPVGEAFLKALTPIINAVSKVADAFNNLPDGVKSAIAIIVGAIAGIGPVLLMTVGLMGNGIANLIKGFQFMRKTLAKLRGDATAFDYLSTAELDAAAAAASLEGKTTSLTKNLLLQSAAVSELTTLYARLAASMLAIPGGIGGGRGGRGPAAPQLRMAKGGIVPGSGNKDSIPTLLTPGETVINKQASQKYAPVIAAMNAGTLLGYNDGLNPPLPSGKMDISAKYGAFIQNKGILDAIIRRFTQAELAADGSLEKLEQAMRELISEGVNPTATAIDAAVKRIKKTELQAASSVAGAQTTVMPSGRAGGQQVSLPGNVKQVAGHISGQILAPTDVWMKRIQANPQAYTKPFIDHVKAAIQNGETTIRLYTNAVATMFDDLNQKMKNGKATIDMVKAEIGNTDAQVMLKKQLQDLGMADDEIERRLLTFVQNLNARLDAVAMQVGGGGQVLSQAAMDKILRRSFVGAGAATFERGSAERRAFNQMLTPTTWVPPGSSGRKPMHLQGGGPQSYTQMDFGYGKRETQFSAAALKSANIEGKVLLETFRKLPIAAQQAVVATKGNLQKALAIFREHGYELGNATTQGAVAAVVHLPEKMLKASGHGSAAPVFGSYGAQDGKLMGEQFVNAVMAAILGHTAPPIPGTTPVDGADDGKKYGLAYWQAAAAAVNKPLPVGTVPARGAAFEAQKTMAATMAQGGMTEEQIARILRKRAEKTRTDQFVSRPSEMAKQSLSRAADYGKVAATAGKMIGAQTIDAISKNKGTLIAASQTALKQSTPAFKGMWNAVADTFKKNVGRAELRRGNIPGFPTIQGRAPMSLGGEVSQITRGIITSLRELPSAIKGIIPDIKNAGKQIAATGAAAKAELAAAWKPIPLQFTVFKESAKTSFTNLTNSIKLGGSALSLALKEAAAKIRSSFGSQIDPATGQKVPGKFARAGMGAGMALSMGSMIPMMAQDKNGKFMGMDAGTASMGMMGGGMLLSMIGMVPGELLAVAAAVGVAGIALKIWRNNVDDAARKAAEFGSNIGGASNAMRNMAQLLGTQTPLQKQTQLQMGTTQEALDKAFGEFTQYLDTEFGQKFLEDLKSITSEQRFEKLSDYLRVAIATGMMDKQKAIEFGKVISASIGDGLLGARIVKDLQTQQQGLRGMLEIARQREQAVATSQGVAAVQTTTKGQGEVSTELASQAIGSSLQVIEDFGTVAAIARDEFNNGKISFEEMRKAVDEARDAQQKYTDIILKGLNEGQDPGAVRQSVAEELIRANKLTKEQYDAAVAKFEELGSKFYFETRYDLMSQAVTQYGLLEAGKMDSENVFADQAAAARKEFENQMQSLYLALVDTSMNPIDAENLATEVLGGDSKLAEIYKQLIEKDYNQVDAAQTAKVLAGYQEQASQASAAVQASARARAIQEATNRGATPQAAAAAGSRAAGVTTTTSSGLSADLIQRYVTSFGGIAADFQAFETALPEARKFSILKDLAAKTDQEIGAYINDFQELNGILENADLAGLITQSQDYQDALAKGQGQNVINAVKEGKQFFGENLQTVINFILETEPPDIETRMPTLIGYAKELDEKVPDDVLKTIGINLQNPEDLQKYGPFADDLNALIPILDKLPTGLREIGINLMTDSNGTPLKPEDFAKASAKINKAYNDLKSGKKDVKKKAILTLLQEIKGTDGETLTPNEADAAYQALIDKYGEKVILSLPQDELTKVINVRASIEGLNQAIATTKAAMAAADPSDRKFFQRRLDQLIALKKSAQTQETGFVEAGKVDAAGNGTTDDGGGGGGEKPIGQQLKKSIKDIQAMTAGITQIMNQNKGIFKNFIAGPFAPGFIEYLKSQGDAGLKVLKGGLNKIKEAYQLYIKEQTALAAQAAKLMPLTIKGLRSQAAGGQRAKQELANIGIVGQEAQSAILDQFDQGFINLAMDAFAKRRKGKKLSEQEKQALKIWAEATNKAVTKEAQGMLLDSVGFELDAATVSAQYANLNLPPEVAQKFAELGISVKDFNKGIQDSGSFVSKLYNSLMNLNELNVLAGLRQEATATKDALSFLSMPGVSVNVAQVLSDAGYSAADLAIALAGGNTELLNIYNTAVKLEKLQGMQTIGFQIRDALQGAQAYQNVASALSGVAGVTPDLIKELQVLGNVLNPEEIRIFANALLSAKVAQEALKDSAVQTSEALDAWTSTYQRSIEAITRKEIKPQEALIAGYQATIKTFEAEIKSLQALQKPYQDEIKKLEKEISPLQKQIKSLQNMQKPIQKDIENLQKQEEALSNQYEKRVKALDQIDRINQRIAAAERAQLNVASAMAQGDIYAATQAALQAKQDATQAASEENRRVLEEEFQNRKIAITDAIKAKEEEIKGIEEQIASIQDIIDQKQTSIEDKREKIAEYDEAIAGWQEKIALENDKIAQAQEKIEASKKVQAELEERIYQAQLLQSMIKQKQAIDEAIQRGAYDEARILAEGQRSNVAMAEALGVKGFEELAKQTGMDIASMITNFKNAVTPESITAMINSHQTAVEAAKTSADTLTKTSEITKNSATGVSAVATNFETSFKTSLEDLGNAIAGFVSPKNGLPKTLGDALTGVGSNLKTAFNGFIEKMVQTLNGITLNFSDVSFSATGKLGQEEVRVNLSGKPGAAKVSPKLVADSYKLATGGVVPGAGSRDSVPTTLTPGEMVIRKSMVGKYGQPMLNSINQGSFAPPLFGQGSINNMGQFSMPKYKINTSAQESINFKTQNTSNISAPMYNNNYSVSVNVSNTNASADDIANKTIMKIQQMQNMKIRSNRGY